jgi:2-octaprenylphenol hydroxylase
MRRSAEFEVLVTGGGVTAAAMAALLMARGLAPAGRVAVIAERPLTERAPADGTPHAAWDLRVFALSRASQRLLTACGAWQNLPAERMCAFERMCVWDFAGTADGPGALSFDSAELGEPNLGFIVEGRALDEQCRRAALAAGVVFIDAAVSSVEIDDTAVSVRLTDGREMQGGLLIAADGADSPTRKLLGIETAGHSYRQDALVAHVRTDRPHRYTAWQRFLPAGPLAFLPLPDGRCSIVWSAERNEAARLMSMDAATFGSALTAASGAFLGACELTTPVARFPLKLQYAVDYVRPRAVLVGDAAHVVHPLAGQGLNLGLLDCATLAEVLRAPGFGGEHRLLRRYERRRRSENMLSAAALDGLERLFSSDDPLLSRLRAAGLTAVGRASFIKRRLMGRAMGVSGDIPEFLRKDLGFPPSQF